LTRVFDRATLLGIALAALFVAASGGVHYLANPRLGPSRDEELLYYPSGFMVRRASLGYETAAADVAWLRGVQYYGEHRLTDMKFGMIDHVMRIVAELDPRFLEAYVFGGFVLAQEMRQPERGLALLEEGMRQNPTSWRLAFEAGFLHYVCRHDYASAGRYFTWASRMPDHAEYVERFAAFANQKAGNTGMAILLWKHTLLTGNAYMQEVARKELLRLGVR
jgi:hypothetical protein